MAGANIFVLNINIRLHVFLFLEITSDKLNIAICMLRGYNPPGNHKKCPIYGAKNFLPRLMTSLL